MKSDHWARPGKTTLVTGTVYACKEDYENYGEGSDIAMDFNEKYDAARLSQAPQGEVDQMREEYQVVLDKPMFREK